MPIAMKWYREWRRPFLVNPPHHRASPAILQYINPPEWDRYLDAVLADPLDWSAAFPTRSAFFSTMNGPASFATFTATGLLLGLLPAIALGTPRYWLMPAALALLLSLYRTAWLALAGRIDVFASCFDATRKRAALIGFGALGRESSSRRCWPPFFRGSSPTVWRH